MTTRKTTSSRSSTRRTNSRSGSSRLYPTRRRRRPGVASTIGSGLGVIIVGALLQLSWPARIGLFVLVLLVGLGYIVWKHRVEIAADVAADQAAAQPGAAPAPGAPADAGPPAAPQPGGIPPSDATGGQR